MSEKMDKQILGRGAFGCVIKPTIPCTRTSKRKKGKVSKLIRLPEYNEKYMSKINEELAVSNNLFVIDPDHYFFIGADESCPLPEDRYEKLIRECFKLGEMGSRGYILNLELEEAYNFKRMLFMHLRKAKHLALCLGHLATAVKLLTDQTEFVLLDIKQDNLLFNVRHGFIFPVLIDFSSDHIITNAPQNWGGYSQIFAKLYYTWTPELKSMVLKARHPELRNEEVFKEVQTNALAYNAKKIKCRHIKNYYTDFDELKENLLISLNTWNGLMTQQTDLIDYAQKTMLWQIGQCLMAGFRNDEEFDSPLALQLAALINQLIHPNVNERLNCQQCFQRLEKIIQPTNEGKHKFMIHIDSNLMSSLFYDEQIRELLRRDD